MAAACWTRWGGTAPWPLAQGEEGVLCGCLLVLRASVSPRLQDMVPPPAMRPPPLFQPSSKDRLRTRWLLTKRPWLGARKISSLPGPRLGGARAKDKNPAQVKKLPWPARPLLPAAFDFSRWWSGEGRREGKTRPSLLKKHFGREKEPQESHSCHPYCVPSVKTSPLWAQPPHPHT